MADEHQAAENTAGTTNGVSNTDEISSHELQMIEQIGEKEARKLKARQEKHQSIWFGLGMFGIVGWSVAVPTLIGIAIGCWLDSKLESNISWCLTFLFGGIATGAAIAWNWLKKEGYVE